MIDTRLLEVKRYGSLEYNGSGVHGGRNGHTGIVLVEILAWGDSLNVAIPIVLRQDNKACISFAEHPRNHYNSKHIDYIHHFEREGVQRET